MKIAISGTSGLVGSTLKEYFLKAGHEVLEISRHRGGKNSSKIFYDPKQKFIEKDALEGMDVIIHLAGATISERWTEAYKKEILESRIQSTKLLANTIKNLNRRPKLFLCASAVGYYGNHDAALIMNEHSPHGQGFLADVCQQWENASAELMLIGVRLVQMRFGVILSKKGGALAKMLPPFYFGLGGRLGAGTQPMSWIGIDEIPRIVDFIMNHEKIEGVVNFVSPQTVTNAEFTQVLGRVIHRPTIFPVPAFMVKLLFGQMGQELLLEGVHVVPQVLVNANYHFQYPHLKEALEQVL